MKNENFIKKQNKGYTLAELLFTVVIMGIVAGLAMPLITSSQYNTELKGQALEIESIIKQAKNLAISGNKSDFAGGVPTYGYGININSSNEISIFTNAINGPLFQYEDVSEAYTSYEGNSKITLPKDIVIDKITNSIGTEIPSDYGANIVFLPPDGQIELTDNRGISGNSFDSETIIYLKHNVSNGCYKFSINKITGLYYKESVTCP